MKTLPPNLTIINPRPAQPLIRCSKKPIFANIQQHPKLSALPLNTNSSSPKDSKSQLPVFERAHEILRVIAENDVTIIQGDTGCGKSTGIPAILLSNSLNCPSHKSVNTLSRIIVTEPRRVAATSLAARVADQLTKDQKFIRQIRRFGKVNLGLGGIVGYRVRFDDRASKDSRITYVTDGLLIRECLMGSINRSAKKPDVKPVAASESKSLQGEEQPILLDQLAQYDYIIIDEAHERSVRIDQLMGMCRLRLRRYKSGQEQAAPPPFKLIVMSATMNIDEIVRFFGSEGSLKVTSMNIAGRSFPVDIYYTPSNMENYITAVVATICQILVTTTNGDVLVFLPGSEEIQTVETILTTRLQAIQHAKSAAALLNRLWSHWGSNSKEMRHFENLKLNERMKLLYNEFGITSNDLSAEDIARLCSFIKGLENRASAGLTGEKLELESWLEIPPEVFPFHDETTREEEGEAPWMKASFLVLPLYAALSANQQGRVFDPPRSPQERKIILATNIAETSITLPYVKYVVDSGKVKLRFGSSLKTVDISTSMGEQRAGRAGRVSAGHCFRLMAEKTFNALENFCLPEIMRSDVAQFVLDIKMLDGVDRSLTRLVGGDTRQPCDPRSLQLPSVPSDKALMDAEKFIQRLSLTGGGAQELTRRGRLVCTLPLPPLWGNLILEAIEAKCVVEILTIVSMSVQECMWFPQAGDANESSQVTLARKRIIHSTGDHMSLMALYDAWKQSNNKRAFCHMLNVDERHLLRTEQTRKQLVEILTCNPLFSLATISSCMKGQDRQVGTDRIMECLAKGLFVNIAVQREVSKTTTQNALNRPGVKQQMMTSQQQQAESTNIVYATYDNEQVSVHPASAFHQLQKKLPKCIVFSSILETTGRYAKIVSAVQEEWALNLRNFRPSLVAPTECKLA